MKTLVALENSNCTRCHNQMLGALREMEGVEGFRSDFSTGCLVIEHEGDPDALVSLIRTVDRAVAVAANGERVMVRVDGHEAAECRVSKAAVPRRLDEEGLMTAPTTSSVETSATEPTAQPSSSTWSSAVTVCPVCHSEQGHGPGRGGVRVLSRERPTRGLVLRVAALLTRMFRVVFEVPSVPR